MRELFVNGIEEDMSNTAVLITDMAILVAIFAVGLLAKMFPRKKNGARQ